MLLGWGTSTSYTLQYMIKLEDIDIKIRGFLFDLENLNKETRNERTQYLIVV